MTRPDRGSNTLQTTALVNEVYLRLVDVENAGWKDRAQFLALSAQMMRRILGDAAGARAASKRGAGAFKVDIDEVPVLSPEPDASVVALFNSSPFPNGSSSREISAVC